MKYKNLIEELYKKRTKGIKLGLERVLSTLEKLGNPHHYFKSVHIAGTNGKGSVSKIIYSLLRAHGLRAGVFTSPHLVRFTERIVVNDREISEEDVVRLIEKIKPFADELTFFEYVTVMAFLYFKEKEVEYAVVETGMGGRLDATNVLKPLVSVITGIGLDHQEFLGSDLSSIAKEKAGIIKERIPVISSSQAEQAQEIIIKKAEEMNAPLYIYGRDFYAKLKSMALDGIVFDFYHDFLRNCQSDLFLPLTGFHQLENVAVALKAFMLTHAQWNESFIREGLKNVKISGRLEVISRDPLIIFDIAHNPHAAESLVVSLKNLTDKKPVVVFGMMRDKDVCGFINCFENYACKIIFTVPQYERALAFEELLTRMNGKKINFISEPVKAFKEGVYLCKNNPELYLLCTGSSYLIGEIKESLGEKALHRSLGEIT